MLGKRCFLSSFLSGCSTGTTQSPKHNPETLPQVPTIFLLYSGSQAAVGSKVGVKGATQREKTDLRDDIFYKPISAPLLTSQLHKPCFPLLIFVRIRFLSFVRVQVYEERTHLINLR